MPFRSVTKGYRGRLQPATHRFVEMEARRPLFCVTLSLTVTLILATVFAVSAWNLERNQFQSDKLTFHGGDEVSALDVCGDFSTRFCDAYEISLWQPAGVYLLPHKALVNNSDTTTHSLTIKQTPNGYMDDRAFYLLEGSSLSLDVCRQNGSSDVKAEVCILRGKHNLDSYHQTSSSKLCQMHRDIPRDVTCDQDSGPISFNLTATANDDYYIVLSYGRSALRRRVEKPRLVIEGFITRTRFSISRAERICQWPQFRPTNGCSFDLSWSDDSDVVIRFTGESDDVVQTSFTSKCHIRLLFWVGLFGGIPLLVSTAASVFFGWLFCRKRARNMKSAQKEGRRKYGRSKPDKDELVDNEVMAEDGGVMAIQDE